jgi:nucleoside-diphosphate-sugar epimerase
MILITGCYGYVGNYLLKRLPKGVMGVDNRQFPAIGRYQDWIFFPGEVRHVIHLAAHSSVAACAADPLGAIDNNLTDAIAFARKMLAGQTLIFASTGSIYSRGSERAVYDLTKELAEMALVSVCSTAGVNLHILRLATVAGVSPTMREDLILNGMTRDAVRTGVVTVRNPGAWRPVLFLSDLAWFVDRILSGEVSPGLHDLASYQARIGSWADIVATATGAKIIEAPDTPTYNFRMPILEGAPGRPDDVIEQLVRHWRETD